ncbi:LacI family DNA-binding transcriptional regulator [Gimibacter soli]|uniref:LacI family DNA-binding transcriptional regulator n=1 Tax=Gimibacter soli TaxID=3024400 RepID=A0AAE9XNV4_9PROT|nr:LacI family DNA-binding transcriptional regulator [Gimibacter soli]WCL53482.1 LacI family DNA-binding transcriptional regulator [Gimibacter soli]
MATKKKSNVTIADVARFAGVSVTTVSRILNGEKYVREDKKKAVTAAVEKLGYRPSLYARSLAGHRSYVIGLLLDDPQGDYLSGIQRGLLRASKIGGLHVLVELFDNDTTFEQVDSFLSSLSLSGAILTPPICDNQVVLAALAKRKIPTVRIAPGRPFGEMTDIKIDNFKAAYRMTEHLIELGHKDIAFITGDAQHADARERVQGFKSAMNDHGLRINPEYICEGTYVFSSGVAAAKRLLNHEKRPSAIFASNDEMAAAVLMVAHEADLNVPQDLSVAGFDDLALASFVTPPLTTIRQPIEEMATAAAARLLDIHLNRNGAPEPAPIILDFSFVKRESTTKFRP